MLAIISPNSTTKPTLSFLSLHFSPQIQIEAHLTFPFCQIWGAGIGR